MKIFGCVDITINRFIYKTDNVFNATTYAAFLESICQKFFANDRKVYYIQDNASYHKSSDIWNWFMEFPKENEYIFAFCLKFTQFPWGIPMISFIQSELTKFLCS